MFRTIVAAIAERGESRAILSVAARAARAAQLPLVVGGVAIATDFVPAIPMTGWAAEPPDVNRLHDDVLRELRGITSDLARDLDVRVDAVVAVSVAEGVETLALRHDAAAIVVGATRHALFTRAFAGDHALSIVNHAPCPVVIAPPEDEGEVRPVDTTPPTRVGVAWDPSHEAETALHAAACFASSVDATLVIIHVIELAWPPVVPPISTSVRDDRLMSRTSEVLATIGAATKHVKSAIEVDVRDGSRFPELAAACKNVDVLFVGSRRKGPLRRVALGSVSGYLAHHSTCPLVIVPRGAPVATAAA